MASIQHDGVASRDQLAGLDGDRSTACGQRGGIEYAADGALHNGRRQLRHLTDDFDATSGWLSASRFKRCTYSMNSGSLSHHVCTYEYIVHLY